VKTIIDVDDSTDQRERGRRAMGQDATQTRISDGHVTEGTHQREPIGPRLGQQAYKLRPPTTIQPAGDR